MKRFDEIKKKLEELFPGIKVKKCIGKIMVVLDPSDDSGELVYTPNCRDEVYKIEIYSPKFIDGDEKLKWDVVSYISRVYFCSSFSIFS